MSQSLTKLYTHLVFATKGRTDTIPKRHINDVHTYIAGILKQNNSPAIAIGGTSNHIHILFALNKNISLSDIVRIVKTNSSKYINEKNGSLNPFFWQDGYGAFSISQSHVDDVKHYLEIQEEHHSKVDFKDEFRKICSIYGVEIDERYVWN